MKKIIFSLRARFRFFRLIAKITIKCPILFYKMFGIHITDKSGYHLGFIASESNFKDFDCPVSGMPLLINSKEKAQFIADKYTEIYKKLGENKNEKYEICEVIGFYFKI